MQERVYADWIFQVDGLENIPRHQTTQSYFLKNQSAWETIALRCILPRANLGSKQELMWIPGFSWALAAAQPIAIDRKIQDEGPQVRSLNREAVETGDYGGYISRRHPGSPGVEKIWNLAVGF